MDNSNRIIFLLGVSMFFNSLTQYHYWKVLNADFLAASSFFIGSMALWIASIQLFEIYGGVHNAN